MRHPALAAACMVAFTACRADRSTTSDAASTPASDAAPVGVDAPADGGHARAAVTDLMARVADWQLRQLAGTHAATWQEATFYAGLVATFTTTGALRFVEAAVAWGDQNAWTPRPDPMHPDNQCAAQTYVELYLLDGVAAHLTGTQAIADQVVASTAPGRAVWWWCDALFMAPPVLARVGAATGDPRYVDALDTRWWDVHDALYDPASDLYFRDASYLTARCPNGEKMFWARGNAWVVAGTVRVLAYLPADHPARGRYVDLLRRMTAKLATLQRPDGFWSSCLTDPASYPEPETSGTSGIVYAMAWGVNHGILDHDAFLPVIRRGWRALAGAVDDNGKLQWVQGVGTAPGPTAQGDSHPYGVGLFLLAGSEVAALADEVEAR